MGICSYFCGTSASSASLSKLNSSSIENNSVVKSLKISAPKKPYTALHETIESTDPS